ncbi:MAG TPA: DUF4340 domain-containing protein, partial [Myxococcaceae bacterium]
MKQPLVTLLIFAVAAGLCACGGSKQEDAQSQRRAPAEKRSDTSTPSADEQERGPAATAVFTQLTVQARGSTTTLEREGDSWRITSPVAAPAEKWVVDTITNQLQALKFKATVAEAPSDADLEKYGLKPPVFTVSAKGYLPDASGGGKDDPARQHSLTLHGGLENPFDGSVYVRRDDDPRVYSADGALRYALEKDVYVLRAKEFLGLDEA